MDLQKTKINEPRYALSLRQNLIQRVFTDLHYSSSFNYQSNDGKDCMVDTIDNLIASQSKV